MKSFRFRQEEASSTSRPGGVEECLRESGIAKGMALVSAQSQAFLRKAAIFPPIYPVLYFA